ncbi:hypothetical protein DRO38_05730 [Candidatus Bathyarchaeota archaeon]|nr:MAG: hypothetical protein DRO38_05730 [Candidatus Bathyarchaeota archaeon]
MPTRQAEKTNSLCYRCEHRANFLEKAMRPRWECGEINSSKFSCYMYKPVRPVKTKVNKGDKRPQFAGAMVSARSHAVEIPECELGLKNGTCFWIPKN